MKKIKVYGLSDQRKKKPFLIILDPPLRATTIINNIKKVRITLIT